MNILLVDDHALLREAIKPLLKQLDDNAILFEAENFAQGLQKLSSGHSFGLVILDMKLPDMADLSGLDMLVKKYPDCPVVVFSGFGNNADVIHAMNAGAAGYIFKTMGSMAMVAALKLVLAGEKFVPAEVLNDVFAKAEPVGSSLLDKLTEREKDVLKHLVLALSNKEIAARMGVREVTVKAHLQSVFAKLGATNRTQAAQMAERHNWF